MINRQSAGTKGARGEGVGGQFKATTHPRGQTEVPRRKLPIQAINSSQARLLAEAKWGTGGTKSEPTGRVGVYYFSCSGHGGYVFDDAVLTQEERTLLLELGFTAENVLTVEDANTGHPDRVSSFFQKLTRQSINITRASSQKTNPNHLVWFMEEDCDFASVELVMKDVVHPNWTNIDNYCIQLADVCKRWSPNRETQIKLIDQLASDKQEYLSR